MSDAISMLVADTVDNAATWIVFFAVLCCAVLAVLVPLLAFPLAFRFAVRQIRRRFVEGRI